VTPKHIPKFRRKPPKDRPKKPAKNEITPKAISLSQPAPYPLFSKESIAQDILRGHGENCCQAILVGGTVKLACKPHRAGGY
jgi:hypothetical protein